MFTVAVRVATLVLLFGVKEAAIAGPVVYDFAGDGFACAYTGEGSTAGCTRESFFGTISIDVNPAGPSGPDSTIVGNTAVDYNGWVKSSFSINWSSGSFESIPVDGANGGDNAALASTDRLFSRFVSTLSSASFERYVGADFDRFSSTPWLPGLVFDTSVGLAPMPANSSSLNSLVFRDYSVVIDPANGARSYSGRSGNMNLTAMTARPATEVPEPSALALMAIGIVAVGSVARRSRGTSLRS